MRLGFPSVPATVASDRRLAGSKGTKAINLNSLAPPFASEAARTAASTGSCPPSALANAAAVGLQRYVAQLESTSGVPARSRVTIRQLGAANGAVVDGGISKALMAMVFVAVFVLWCLLLIAVTRFRADWRASAVFESAAIGPTVDADALAIEEDRPRIGGPIRLDKRQHADDRSDSSTEERPASASLTQTVG